MKNKLKMISILAAAALSLSVVSCDEQEDDEQEDYEEKHVEYATLKINTENLPEEQIEDEIISLGNKNSGVYAIFKLGDEGTAEVAIECAETESTISSSILEKYICIDEIELDDVISLNINYLNGKMEYDIENLKSESATGTVTTNLDN